MKRTYAKPSMTVERFLANVAVASCTSESWQETNIPEQPIECYRSGVSEDLFNIASSCDNYPIQYVFFNAGTYTPAQLYQGGLTALEYSDATKSVTVPAGGGYVLVWSRNNSVGGGGGHGGGNSGSTNCYGLATAKITTIFQSSY